MSAVKSAFKRHNIVDLALKLPLFLLSKLQGVSTYRKIIKTFQPKMDIRIADTEDMKEIYAWFTNDSAQAPPCQDPNVTNIVAKKKKKIIAYVQLVRRPATTSYAGYWLFSLKVKSVYKGMGIGNKLSSMVIELAMQEGAKELLLQVDRNNRKALRLYQNLGFTIKEMPAIETLSEKKRTLHGQHNVIMSKFFNTS